MGLAAIIALVVAASDAGTPDAGPWDDVVYADCPAAPPPTQLGDGSWVLPPLRAARNACLLSACDEDRRELAAGPPFFSPETLIFGVIMGLVFGLAGMYFGWLLFH